MHALKQRGDKAQVAKVMTCPGPERSKGKGIKGSDDDDDDESETKKKERQGDARK